MDFSFIGRFSLNISFVLYLIFYFPQLIHNIKNNNIQELSLLMHFILYLATIADLIYGFGRDMQWQYQLVTIVGLICLTIQHLQICYHQKLNQIKNKNLLAMTIFLTTALLLAIYFVYSKTLPAQFLLTAGTIAQIGLFTFTIPQIIKNNLDNTTIGISIYFVLLSFALNFLDSISAWALNWDWPSKIGSPTGLLLNVVLLHQFWIYKNRTTSATFSCAIK